MKAQSSLQTLVAHRVRIDCESGCWNWTSSKGRHGYGRAHLSRNAKAPAHRVAFEAYREPIQDGLVLDHLCKNKRCVNPWHLEPVTQRENTLRGTGPTSQNAKATHCIKGHPFTDSNTYHRKDGHRVCRTCNLARDKAYREAEGDNIRARRRARALVKP